MKQDFYISPVSCLPGASSLLWCFHITQKRSLVLQTMPNQLKKYCIFN